MALRPKQWTKNGLLFAGLIYSGSFTQPWLGLRATVACMAFCLLSSSGYLLNDFMDRKADAQHPKKRFRPIASGDLPAAVALMWMVMVLLAGMGTAWSVSGAFLIVGLLYLATTLTYSLYFKHVVILDVMFIASGFVWRAVAGAVAIEVRVSEWLFLCTAFLALFIGFNKRRVELEQLGNDAGTRKNLVDYSPDMLHQFQAIVTGAVVVCYALYTVHGTTKWMTLTIPFVLYGIFRYIYLVDQKGEGGAPDETFLRDLPILITVALYLMVSMGVLQAETLGWLPPFGEPPQHTP